MDSTGYQRKQKKQLKQIPTEGMNVVKSVLIHFRVVLLSGCVDNLGFLVPVL